MDSHQILIQCYGIQAQLALLKLTQVEAEGKEYQAPWLKNSGKVMRDGLGRFYSNTKQSVGDAVTGAQEVTDGLVQGLLGDEGFLKRAGLQAGQFGGEVVRAIQNAPAETVKALEKASASIQESLLREYEGANELLAKSVKEAKIPEPPADAPLHEKFRYQAAVLNALQENVRETDNFKGAMKALGQIAKASLPVVSTMALIAIPEVAIAIGTAISEGHSIPVTLGIVAQNLSPMEIAVKAGLLVMTEALHTVALDLLKIENEVVRSAVLISSTIAFEANLTKAWGSMTKKALVRHADKLKVKPVLDKINQGLAAIEEEVTRSVKSTASAITSIPSVPMYIHTEKVLAHDLFVGIGDRIAPLTMRVSTLMRGLFRGNFSPVSAGRIDDSILLPGLTKKLFAATPAEHKELKALFSEKYEPKGLTDTPLSSYNDDFVKASDFTALLPIEDAVNRFIRKQEDSYVSTFLEKAATKAKSAYDSSKETLYEFMLRVGDLPAIYRKSTDSFKKKYFREPVPNTYDTIPRRPAMPNRLSAPPPIPDGVKTVPRYTLAEPFGQKVKTLLTEAENEAIDIYTTAAYKPMNAYLRHGAGSPEFDEAVRNLPPRYLKGRDVPNLVADAVSGLARLPRYKGSHPLTRIIRDPDKAVFPGLFKKIEGAKGSTLVFEDPAFLSFTSKPHGVKNFLWDDLLGSKDRTVKIVVHPPEISNGRDLGFVGVDEVLYPPGQKFKYLKHYTSPVKGQEKGVILELEELP